MNDQFDDIHGSARSEPKPIKLARNRDEAASERGGMNLAASWYVAMPSSKLKKTPVAIELFGKDLVAWRDREGRPVLMDRYCSHQGVSLSLGKIVDGCIQCPFHHWRFDSSGQCVSTYGPGESIPKTARQRTYELVERYGYIWVWYGTQSPLFQLPAFPAMGEERARFKVTRWVRDVTATVCPIMENAYDAFHFAAVHDVMVSAPPRITIVDEDHPVNEGKSPVAKEARLGARVEVDATHTGAAGALASALGIRLDMVVMYTDSWPSGHVMRVFVSGVERLHSLLTVTPVSKNRTLWHLVSATLKTGNLLLDPVLHAGFTVSNYLATGDDQLILNTIDQSKGGAYTKLDKGVLRFRSFYQSWVDKVEWAE